MVATPSRTDRPDIDAYLAQHEHKELLRFLTCGTVDDGKSTLIGRLLLRLAADLRGPAGRRRAATAQRKGSTGGEVDLSLLDRRPQGRARAGHHDRRRLPLLLDQPAQVHHRRLPGPRAVHAQHGDRRLDLRPGDHPDRRPPRRACSRRGATASSSRCSASSTSSSPSTRWTSSTGREEVFERDQARLHRLRHAARDGRPALHADLGAEGRQRRRAEHAHALVPGRDAAAPARDGAHRLRSQPDRPALPGAVRQPARTSTSAASAAPSPPASSATATRSWSLPSDQRSRVKSLVTYDGDRARGVPAAGGHRHARGRDRRQPRRHAGATRTTCRASIATSRRCSCG